MTTWPEVKERLERRSRHAEGRICEVYSLADIAFVLARVRDLEEALKSARGWVITCSESATARRDLAKIDEILGDIT